MNLLKKLKLGQRPSSRDYNMLVDAVNRNAKITGGRGIQVATGIFGTRIWRNTSTDAPIVRKAFVKTLTPSKRVTVYLDIDSTGEEAFVYCEVCGGTDITNAAPVLTVGSIIMVVNISTQLDSGDEFQGLLPYTCTTTFSVSRDCLT